MSIEEMIGKENIAKGKYWRLPLTLVSGCTRCSPGCDHCWALTMERRFKKLPTKKWPESEIELSPIQIHPERLDIPLKRKKPTVYALWNDLFHEDVPDEFIQAAYMRMWNTQQKHIYLVFTKRIARARHHYNRWLNMKQVPKNLMCASNIWLGVTVCNQAEADEKIPILLKIPAAVRWISIEPMLGPIDLKYPVFNGAYSFDSLGGINWVILGGETGPGARLIKGEWVSSVRDQCIVAGVPFFFKNWGTYHKLGKPTLRMIGGREWNELPGGQK